MAKASKKTTVLYWIFTGIFIFFMAGSAIPDLLVMDMAVKGFADIGLTHHLVFFLGVAKLLGVIAILIPGFPRVTEWAYAGLTFDLAGAIYLIMCVDPAPQNWMPIVIPIVFAFLSYSWYHKRLAEKKSTAAHAA